jgi:hypothetical protein
MQGIDVQCELSFQFRFVPLHKPVNKELGVNNV